MTPVCVGALGGPTLGLHLWAGGSGRAPGRSGGKRKQPGSVRLPTRGRTRPWGAAWGAPTPQHPTLPPRVELGPGDPPDPRLQPGFPTLPQFPHLQNGVNKTKPSLKPFRGPPRARGAGWGLLRGQCCGQSPCEQPSRVIYGEKKGEMGKSQGCPPTGAARRPRGSADPGLPFSFFLFL